MIEYMQVTTTVSNKEEAEKISRTVVEKRLSGCVQIIGPITSTYWWKQKIETAEEWLCIMKSRVDLYRELEYVIKNVHSYDVPEILVTKIAKGSKNYLNWLEKELKKKSNLSCA